MSLRRPFLFLAALLLLCVTVGAQSQFDDLGPVALGSSPAQGALLVDVDRDGDLDVVLAAGGTTSGGLPDRLYLNDGHGGLTDVTATQFVLQNPANTNVLVAGDVDGDGDVDVLAGTSSQDYLYRNDGSGGFSSARLSITSAQTFALVLADFDGDGDLDLLAVGLGAGKSRLYLNDGTGTFRDVSATKFSALLSGALSLFSAAAGDVDGDGDQDIVASSSRPYLFLNDGAAGFTDATAGRWPTLGVARIVELADVDLDGDLDVFRGDWSAPVEELYLNDGTGRFTDVSSTHLPPPTGMDLTVAATFADVDLDGDPDAVLTRWSVGLYGALPAPPVLYVNDGRGVFHNARARMPGRALWTAGKLVAGDLDGDGDLDLIYPTTPVTKPTDPASGVYWNLYRQLDSPTRPRIGGTADLVLYAQPGFATEAQVALSWLALGLLPAPVTIPGFGMFHLDPLRTFPMGLPLPVLQPSGRAAVSFAIPADPRLVGRAYWAQAGFLHGPNRANWHFSNLVGEIIGR